MLINTVMFKDYIRNNGRLSDVNHITLEGMGFEGVSKNGICEEDYRMEFVKV